MKRPATGVTSRTTRGGTVVEALPEWKRRGAAAPRPPAPRWSSVAGVLIVGFVLLWILAAGVFGAESSHKYEDDLRSGQQKVIQGDAESMTDSEKRAVEDFQKWQDKQD